MMVLDATAFGAALQAEEAAAASKRQRVETPANNTPASNTPANNTGLQSVVSQAAPNAAGAMQGGLVLLSRTDKGHINGQLELEQHIKQMEGAISSTHQIIISKSLGQPTSKEFNLVNGRVGSATCIMLYTPCTLTAEALIFRYQKGGFVVTEDEQTVDYTFSDGRKWYEEASVKEASVLATDDVLAFVYAGLPNPAAIVDFYVAHGEKHYGKLARDPILNTHTFGGVKTTKLDGSITLVFNNDKKANAVAKTPRMINNFIKAGELNLNKAEIRLINGVCCRDDSCRAINGAHKPSCRENEIVGKAKAIKVSAIKKSFSDLIQDNSEEVLRVREHLKAQ